MCVCVCVCVYVMCLVAYVGNSTECLQDEEVLVSLLAQTLEEFGEQ